MWRCWTESHPRQPAYPLPPPRPLSPTAAAAAAMLMLIVTVMGMGMVCYLALTSWQPGDPPPFPLLHSLQYTPTSSPHYNIHPPLSSNTHLTYHTPTTHYNIFFNSLTNTTNIDPSHPLTHSLTHSPAISLTRSSSTHPLSFALFLVSGARWWSTCPPPPTPPTNAPPSAASPPPPTTPPPPPPLTETNCPGDMTALAPGCWCKTPERPLGKMSERLTRLVPSW